MRRRREAGQPSALAVSLYRCWGSIRVMARRSVVKRWPTPSPARLGDVTMTRPILALIFIVLCAAPAAARWLGYPSADLRAPPTASPTWRPTHAANSNGTPDLSGHWRLNGLGYVFNVSASQKVEMSALGARRLCEAVGRIRQGQSGLRLPASGPTPDCSGCRRSLVRRSTSCSSCTKGRRRVRSFCDGRPLPKGSESGLDGLSVGRWDGDTLVVDTVGCDDRTWLDITAPSPHRSVHVTVRYRQAEHGRVEVEMTFDNPHAYARSWTIPVDPRFVPDTELLEHVCNGNEKSAPATPATRPRTSGPAR